jgi:hypothetical protein
MAKQQAYEWILEMSGKAEDKILTENQYEAYREARKNGDTGVMFFKNFEINPPFVISAYKRKAEYLFKLYPCLTCNTNGELLKTRKDDGTCDICPTCKGTGIDTSQEPHLEGGEDY